mgnify:CR=1 FL=1
MIDTVGIGHVVYLPSHLSAHEGMDETERVRWRMRSPRRGTGHAVSLPPPAAGHGVPPDHGAVWSIVRRVTMNITPSLVCSHPPTTARSGVSGHLFLTGCYGLVEPMTCAILSMSVDPDETGETRQETHMNSLTPCTLTIPAPTFTIDDMLASPDVSYWLKDRLREIGSRDAVDHASDVEVLLRYVFAVPAYAALGAAVGGN